MSTKNFLLKKTGYCVEKIKLFSRINIVFVGVYSCIMEKIFNLNDRLISFAVLAIDIADCLPKSLAGLHIAGQLVRSGTSPALNYGEAQSAESRNDFIHKMKISAKELRETYNCLQIIERMEWLPDKKLVKALDENNQLIAIFVKSIKTAKKNRAKKE